MLSAQETKDFLVNVLEMADDIENLHQNKEGFLDTFLRRFMHVEPFQSILAIAKSPKDRHLPSFQEIKADIFARRGGNCYGLGYFAKEILQSLGYDIYYVGCMVYNLPKYHLALIVRNLNKPGDRHLVDIGTSFPTWKPIPLYFDTASPVYENGFLSYKLIRKDENSILMYHKRNKYVESSCYENTAWYEFYELCLDPCEIGSFLESMTKMCTDPHYSPFPYLLSVRAVIYRDNKLFALKDCQQMYENDKKELTKEDIISKEELIKLYLKNFPQFDEDTIRIALEHVSMSD